MAIKTIQVSKLETGPWSTLAGSSGEISVEGAELTNTIFGSEFQSSIAGIKSWSFSGNSYLRETAGYQASIKKAGTPVSVTGEQLFPIAGDFIPANTYAVVNVSHEIWDVASTITIYEDGVEVPADEIVKIDPMFGRVTFAGAPSGVITADFSYLTATAFGCANSVSLTLNSEATDNSCFETVKAENGFAISSYGLKTVSAELSGFYRASNDFFLLMNLGDTFVLEFDFEGNGYSVARGLFRLQSTSNSGDVGSQEEYSASFSLYVPEDLVPFSFGTDTDTTMSASVIEIIDGWINRTPVFLRYMPEGLGGAIYLGETIVTDCSISLSVDSIGEISVELTGTGELNISNRAAQT